MTNRFDFLEIDPRRGMLRRTRAPGEAAPVPAAATTAPARSAARWKVVELIGGPGTAAGEFASPGGLAVDARGNLFVADSYNHRVQRITPQGDVAAIGRRGGRPGEFLNPQAVAVAPEGAARPRFYVLEQGNHRIQVFEADGTPVAAWGSRGAEPDQLHSPMGLAVDPTGNLYVADTGNRRVVRWSPAGQVTAVLNVAPGGSPLFAKPQGVGTDRAGRLYVADTLSNQVLVFDAGLRLLARMGEPGSAPGQFAGPQDLALDVEGHLFVVEAGNHRLQVLDGVGHSLQCLDQATRLGRFQSPSAVAVALDGSVFIADTGNHRLFRLSRQ